MARVVVRADTRSGRALPSQELLLKAALFRGDAATSAWNEWIESGDLSALDPGSQRLLPLLYKNLRAAGIADRRLDAIKSIYRMSWTKNQFILAELENVLRRLEDAGIRTMLLKGVALVHVVYKDRGVRPMTDVDILVPLERAGDAIDVLEAHGLHSAHRLPRRLIGVRHADEFTDGRRLKCDLHWSVLQECTRPGDNDDFWVACRELHVGSATTHVLCPADQLLHVCIHGSRSGMVQPVMWVADAISVIESAGNDIDWQRVVAQATKRRLVVPIREALRYLRSEFGAPIPSWVVDRLSDVHTSRAERLEHRIKLSRRRLVGTLPVLWFDHWRRAEGGTCRKAIGFPRYLQITFRCETLPALPIAMLGLAGKRIALTLTSRH